MCQRTTIKDMLTDPSLGNVALNHHEQSNYLFFLSESKTPTPTPQAQEPCHDDDSDIPDQLHLLQSGEQADVTLQCEKKCFRVHSHILSARSDVLKVLIDDLDENKHLWITDTSPLVIEKVLHYMYSGELPKMSFESAMKVYKASEVYLMESLKTKCATVIKRKLSETNACDALVFSDTVKGDCMKEDIIKYLISKKSFLESETWRKFCDLHPKLVTEVHIAFIKSVK